MINFKPNSRNLRWRRVRVWHKIHLLKHLAYKTCFLNNVYVTSLLYVEKDIVNNVKDVVFVQGKHFSPDSNQKGWEKYALNPKLVTLIYYPKQRFVLESRYNTFLALTPLSKKKYSRRRVVSIKVLGISSLIELILRSQFLHIYWADSGMLDPSRSLMLSSSILSSE